jgi:hypothetical protein
MAATLRLLLDGTQLADAARRSKAIISGRTGSVETVNAIDAALSAARSRVSDHRRAIDSLGGGGWTGEDALAIGLYSALAAQSLSASAINRRKPQRLQRFNRIHCGPTIRRIKRPRRPAQRLDSPFGCAGYRGGFGETDLRLVANGMDGLSPLCWRAIKR